MYDDTCPTDKVQQQLQEHQTETVEDPHI